MGGYGLYVWGSFGACALLMATETVLVRQRYREICRLLARDRLAENP
jgi:heme exporter protein D